MGWQIISKSATYEQLGVLSWAHVSVPRVHSDNYLNDLNIIWQAVLVSPVLPIFTA